MRLECVYRQIPSNCVRSSALLAIFSGSTEGQLFEADPPVSVPQLHRYRLTVDGEVSDPKAALALALGPEGVRG